MSVRPVPTIPESVARASDFDLAVRVCRDGLCTDFSQVVNDPQYAERWHPASEPRASATAKRRAYEIYARTVCRPCPAAAHCLELALRAEEPRGRHSHGIAGGTAPWERKALIRARRDGGAGRAVAVAA